MQQKASKAVAVYAEALVELALEEKALEKIDQDLFEMAIALYQEKEVWSFFSSPIINVNDKINFLNKALVSSGIHKILLNFLCVLIKRARFQYLLGIQITFHKIALKQMSKQEVKIYSAKKLDEETKESIKKAWEKYSGTEAILEEEIKPELLGGVILRAGDFLVDTSLHSRLLRLSRHVGKQRIEEEKYYEN